MLNDFVNCDFFTKLLGIDPCKKHINACRHFFMANLKQWTTIYVVKQARGYDIWASVSLFFLNIGPKMVDLCLCPFKTSAADATISWLNARLSKEVQFGWKETSK